MTPLELRAAYEKAVDEHVEGLCKEYGISPPDMDQLCLILDSEVTAEVADCALNLLPRKSRIRLVVGMSFCSHQVTEEAATWMWEFVREWALGREVPIQ